MELWALLPHSGLGTEHQFGVHFPLLKTNPWSSLHRDFIFSPLEILQAVQ
jgi:hypothetical protein